MSQPTGPFKATPDHVPDTTGRAPAATEVRAQCGLSAVSAGPHDGRVKRAVKRALVLHGGRCTTADAMRLAYPDVAWTKGAYRNVRRASREVAVAVCRAKDPPGNPLLWVALTSGGGAVFQTAANS